MKCTNCALGRSADLRNNCLPSNFLINERAERPRILLITENVSKEDDMFGQNLSEQSTGAKTGAQLVWSVIDQAGIPRDAVNVVSLTRCANRAKDGKLIDEYVAACLPYLWEELRARKPEIVVCMGLNVTKYLTSIKKLAAARGHYGTFKLLKGLGDVPDDLQNIPVTSTVTPGSVWAQEFMSTGTGRSQLSEDLSSIWRKLDGKLRDDRCDYAWMESLEDIEDYFGSVERQYAMGLTKGCVVDIETNQMLDPYNSRSKLVAIGFCSQPWVARAIKIHHKDERFFSTFGTSMWEWFCRRLQQFFDRVPVAGWNFKFDTKWIKHHTGAMPRKVFFDGHLAHYLTHNYDLAKHDLKTAAAEMLGTPIAEAEMYAEMLALAKAGYEKHDIHMGNISEVTLLSYLGGDVDSTYRLYQVLDPMIDNDHVYYPLEYQQKYPGHSTRWVYENLMLPSVLAFAEIEENGIAVDELMLDHLRATYPAKLEALLAPIFATTWAQQVLPTIDPKKAKHTLISSYTNLSKLLYEVVGFPAEQLGFEKKSRKAAGGGVVYYYPTGKPQREKLKDWAGKNNKLAEAKLIDDIEAYKKAEKLHSAYIKRMPEYIEGDSFLHTNYNVAGTATGRASTSNPSLHIIPKKSDVKKMFTSRWHSEGGVILQFDYAQLEMRLVAAIADDPVLRSVFESGTDTHRQMAAFIFRKPEDQITDDERSKGKTIAFGVLYGMQAPAMAGRTQLPLEVAEEKIKNFFKQFRKVAKWMDQQKTDANARAVIKPGTGRYTVNNKTWKQEHIEYAFEQYGYITTVFGRKRILRGAKHWKRSLASGADRQAFNTPIQGTASDMAFEAVLNIHARIKADGLKSRLFGWIHDSIEVDVYPGEFLQVYRIMREEMEDAPKRKYDWLKVPIKASAEVGHGWGYMVEITKIDEAHGIVEVEGDESNVYSLIRALSANSNVEIQCEDLKEKKGKKLLKSTLRIVEQLSGRAA